MAVLPAGGVGQVIVAVVAAGGGGPDGHAVLAASAQAATDAHDPEEITSGGATATTSGGRTYDEVVASVRAHKDEATYAAALIHTSGPEDLTQPLDVNEHFTVDAEYGPQSP